MEDWHRWSGWGFNKEDYGSYPIWDILHLWWQKKPLADFLSMNQELLKEQLKTSPAFFKEPAELFGGGSDIASQLYAIENKNQLLTLAFPSTTFGIGANKIGGGKISYKNMNADIDVMGDTRDDIKTNGWVKSRDEDDQGWLHNDYQDVSFVYTYKIYKYIVKKGGLK